MSFETIVRRIGDRFQQRMIVVPLAFTLGAIVLAQLMLLVDRQIQNESLPDIVRTTVDSAQQILATIAGGLISAITLLLSLVLVAVQLASSQFSPRTVQDWIGDRTQQRTIGIVLGTTVYCLMVLRETQTSDSLGFAPNLSVALAVVLAVVSLIAVVRSVDHMSNSMRIGSVARGLAEETRNALADLGGSDMMGTTRTPSVTSRPPPRLDSGVALVAPKSGWIQHVDLGQLAAGIGTGRQASLEVGPGAFVFEGQPLAWIDLDTGDQDDAEGNDENSLAGDEHARAQLASNVFSVGDTRVVDHDVAFGLLQMSDIALRALSPGVNDPNTACDVIAYIGSVLMQAWGLPEPPDRVEIDDCTVDLVVTTHNDYLETGLAQILRYGADEFEVLATLQRTLETVRAEAVRRDLPGPREPLDEMLREVHRAVEHSELSSRDKRRLELDPGASATRGPVVDD